MILTVASGKGGTGKTLVAVNLAFALKKHQNLKFLDCDVEAPNSHIFLKPHIKQLEPVYTRVPEVIAEKCTYCGKCAEICAYNALAVLKNNVLVFEDLCHSCGGCSLLCPEEAIIEKNKRIGIIEWGYADNIQFVHGKLDIGQAISPPLIKSVKNDINPAETNIIDAPPGTSCPVIASVLNSDYALLVTEPTPFGLHDLKLAIETVRQLAIPFGVVVNRTGIGPDIIQDYCDRHDVPVVMSIPLDKRIAEAYSRGDMVCEVLPEYKSRFEELAAHIDKIK